MERHKKTHTGQKDYFCHLCSSAFSRRDTLKVHIISKHGEKALENFYVSFAGEGDVGTT